MKLTHSIALALTLAMLLQGCGSNNKASAEQDKTTVAKEVHGIAPEKISGYIDTFNTQIEQVDFQFEGKEYDISFTGFMDDEPAAIAQFERGFVIFGFDQDKQTPLPTLSIVETIDGDNLVLRSSTITVSEDGNNIIYQGTVENPITQGIFSVRFIINESFFGAGNSRLEIDNNTATLNGTLGTKTYIQIAQLIEDNPSVDTLILQQIDGSINDDINMHTGRLIHQAKLTTVVPSDGDVNSGGVDLFAAGFKREYRQGGKVGVHSWCCVNGKSAHLLPKDDAAHGAQLTYFREILGKELGPQFYYFTINAAPADSIHVMTQTQLTKYLLTK